MLAFLRVENHLTLEDLKWQILFKILYSGKIFIDIHVNADQISMGFEEDTLRK